MNATDHPDTASDPLTLLDRDEATQLLNYMLEEKSGPRRPVHCLMDAFGWLTCLAIALVVVVFFASHGQHLEALLAATGAGVLTTIVVGCLSAAWSSHRERDIETIVGRYDQRRMDSYVLNEETT